MQTYSRCPRAPPPLPDPSLDSGSGNPMSPIVSHPPRYPSRDRNPPSRYGWLCSTNHPISKYISYDGISTSYRAFLGQIESISIPQSMSEALQNSNWVAAMQTEMEA